jgi:hypothetical protein
MASSSNLSQNRLIEQRILALACRHRRLMFSELAAALPDYTWCQLFVALSILQQIGRIQMTVHRWDYEICDSAAHDHSPVEHSEQ